VKNAPVCQEVGMNRLPYISYPNPESRLSRVEGKLMATPFYESIVPHGQRDVDMACKWYSGEREWWVEAEQDCLCRESVRISQLDVNPTLDHQYIGVWRLPMESHWLVPTDIAQRAAGD
jgi:hypothetical protein